MDRTIELVSRCFASWKQLGVKPRRKRLRILLTGGVLTCDVQEVATF